MTFLLISGAWATIVILVVSLCGAAQLGDVQQYDDPGSIRQHPIAGSSPEYAAPQPGYLPDPAQAA